MVTLQVCALIAGAIFVLIAAIGGNFSAQGINVPPVPKIGRIALGVAGVLFISYSVVTNFVPSISGLNSAGDSGEPSVESSSNASASPREHVIHKDDPMVTSPDGIMLKRIAVVGTNDPPQVNDRITINFTLQNVGLEPVTLNSIFTGARNPADKNEDFGHDYDRVLAPNDEVHIKNFKVVTEDGVWKFWPCYEIEGTYCPDEWRAFEIFVVKR